MADRFWACIEIGGRLRQADVPRFCKEARIDPCDLPEYLQEGRFVLENSEAAYGRFEDLEDLCQELGLAYRRQSDGKYEFTPEIVAWRPGLEEPDCVLTDHMGDPVIALGSVRKIYDALKAGHQQEALALAVEALAEPAKPPPLEIAEG